ncbi:MAG TPA: fibronectin type III domain-containing protein, partial [Baekduia sp.]|nr:fibronectin type III domain-containing protein [Baekduia sp.]
TRGFAGTDTFTYKLLDAAGDYAIGTVNVTVNAAAPPAPDAPVATAGLGQASVTFSPPGDDGGSAITGYTVTASPGGQTATGSGSPMTISGLTPGMAYTFTVRAANAVGTGAVSPASSAVTIPAAPSVAIATPAPGQTYTLGQAVAEGFTCTEGAGGPGIATCVDQDGHASGAALDTTTLGTHTLTVTATSGDTLTGAAAVSYVVVAAGSSSPSPDPGSGATTTPVGTGIAGTGTASPPAPVAPVLTKVSVKPTSFRVRKSRGTGHQRRVSGGAPLRFTLSAAATVTARVETVPAKGKKARLLGTLALGQGRAGANSVTLTGKVGRRTLAPGRYRLTLTATAGGLTSRAVTVTVTVRRG